jgi:hypothetical protein
LSGRTARPLDRQRASWIGASSALALSALRPVQLARAGQLGLTVRKQSEQ